MFSSFSHFLPSSLQSSPQKNDSIRTDDDDDEEDNKSDVNPDEAGVVEKKKKDKSPNETFIFVRPPPAKTNHPLNLQVQLIPPNSRGPSGLTSASRQSLDLSATPSNSVPSSPVESTHDSPGYEQGAPLSRTSSTASSTHSRSSSTSTYSAASTNSSTSSRRMIVPLYNLQAHNVMANIIVDAGTDAKIAKFSKKGIEMLELAVLEPVEVYAGGGAPVGGETPAPGAGSAFSTKTLGGRTSMNLQVPAGSSRPGTPDPATNANASTTNSSQASLASSSAHSSQPSAPSDDVAPAAQVNATPQKKNLFGKLFKRKDEKESPTTGTFTPTPTQTPVKGFGHARSRSALSGTPRSPSPNPAAAIAAVESRKSISSLQRSSVDMNSEDAHYATPTQASTAATTSAAAIGHGPILGVLPSVSSPVHPPKGRPGLYVWVVKRWMKGDGGGLLSVAKGMVRGHGQDARDMTGEVEVRFEWKRGKSKGKGKKARKEKDKEKERDKDPERLVAPPLGSANSRLSTNTTTSVISRQSSFSAASVSEEGQLVGDQTQAQKAARRQSLALSERDLDDGEESDPEDSETPWTCTVKVRRLTKTQHSRPLSFSSHSREPTGEPEASAGGRREVLKVKVGTLSPTPHHPKVVAMLKVPFPLPDVDVEKMKVERRELGVAAKGHSLMLTAEEIKDVVCSTGLWLVVREGFGGIGKVSRKGDGWRIRG